MAELFNIKLNLNITLVDKTTRMQLSVMIPETGKKGNYDNSFREWDGFRVVEIAAKKMVDRALEEINGLNLVNDETEYVITQFNWKTNITTDGPEHYVKEFRSLAVAYEAYKSARTKIKYSSG